MPLAFTRLVSAGRQTRALHLNHEGTAMDVQSGPFTITTNGQCSSLMVVSVGDRKISGLNDKPPTR